MLDGTFIIDCSTNVRFMMRTRMNGGRRKKKRKYFFSRHLCFVHKTTYLWSMSSPGGGESSLSACPGIGNRLPSEKKIANPRGYARGGF